MKVLNLCCARDHRFEGWFGSDEDFESQIARGLVECPVCAATSITRLPSAPRLNVSGAREEPAAPAHDPQQRMRTLWLQAVRQMVERSEDVGERFAEEARRIHYGETPERSIRGQASREDAQSLRDEGIEVMSLPLPAALKGPVQ